MKSERIENQLVMPMVKHLIGDAIDLAQDYSEMPLDAFLQPGLLQEVPVVGTVVKLGKSVLTIRDIRMARNYYIFISKVREAAQTDKEIQEHIVELENNRKKMQNELEMLLVYIDEYKELEKAEYLANIYLAYLAHSKSEISWETATDFFEILDRILLQDIRELEKVITEGASSALFSDHSGLLRLSALGLLQYFNGKEELYGHNKKGLAKITCQGKLFYGVIKYGKAFSGV